ncbi:ATP-binding cassette sub- A member 3, partial [Borealophlyctis nickersoniae]
MFLPSWILACVIVKYTFYTNTELGVLVLWWVAMGVSVIGLGFLGEVAWRSPRSGSMGGAVLFVALAVAGMFINTKLWDLSTGVRNLLSLLSPMAFIYANRVIANLEGQNKGLTFSNWNDDVNGLRFTTCFAMLLIDTLLYFCLAWYLSQIVPTATGVPRPWYFPFTRSYWTNPSTSSTAFTDTTYLGSDAPVVEPVHGDVKAGISVRGLCKTFKHPNSGKVQHAVRDLTVDAYEGETMVLLGKNGAGKTTLISMLTGLISPSAGTALIRNRPIQSARTAQTAFETLGVCPQHDVLWDTLTVRQHLNLFAGLKGVPITQVAATVADTITRCDLQEKADSYVSTLSGGQKRKLSVAIAYVGGSRVVILDEPTSGMDPLSRRAIWDVINRNKEGRTVILTTHFMDEAENLGDRIAIMAVGRLKAWGTSMFLKREFGVGYTLTIVKHDGAKASHIARLVTHFVENAEQSTEAGAEVGFKLPKEARGRFAQLLRALDGVEGRQVGVKTYGLSVTSLEEVFIRIALRADEKEAQEEFSVNEGLRHSPGELEDSDYEMTAIDIHPQKRFDTGAAATPGGASFFRQTWTLFLKVVQLNRRQPILPAVRFIAPIIATILGAYMMKGQDGTCRPNPPAPIEPLTWSNTHPLIVQPDRTLAILANSTLNLLPVADDAAYQYEVDHDTYNFTAALRFPTYTPGAPPSTWDGSFTAAQGSLDGDLISQSTAINLAHNALLASRTPNTSTHPVIRANLHRFDSPRAQESMDGGTIGAALILTAVYALGPAVSASALVRERVGRSKHQQRVSGARPLAYWTGYWLWDLVNSVVTSVVAVVVFKAFGTPMVSDNLGWIFAVIL